MISRFQCRASGRRPATPPAADRAQAAVLPELVALLQSLLGREISVTFGVREVRGKLIAAHPVTLVGQDGAVTVVLPAQITSVQF